MIDLKTYQLRQPCTELMNILFSHFEIKSSAAPSSNKGPGEVEKANYGQRNVQHYIHMSRVCKKLLCNSKKVLILFIR